jgi:hypothetical protein
MKHWDLNPGENVTLSNPGRASRHGYFAFRDTIHAVFMLDDGGGNFRAREFILRDDGTLSNCSSEQTAFEAALRDGYTINQARDMAMRSRDRWTIEGADRNTRSIIGGNLRAAGGAS